MNVVQALMRSPAILMTLAMLLAILGGCASRGAVEGAESGADDAATTELDRLKAWMTGAFEARPEPGGPESTTQYMLIVPILSGEPDRWLYVVQWKEGSEDPERQFVYQLRGGTERGLALDIHSLLRPIADPTSPSSTDLESIRRSDIERREGCRIRLSQDGLSFVGGTRGRDCRTEYRGANKLRIELTIRGDEVREWLQGYDAEGERLWSADNGGRVFQRVGER